MNLLAQNIKKYSLCHLSCVLIPSNNEPATGLNLFFLNYFSSFVIAKIKFANGSAAEHIIMQNHEMETPIASPNKFISGVIAFKYPLIKNSIIPSIAMANKLLKKSPLFSL